MKNFTVVETDNFSKDVVSEAMFGTNFVTTYDYEFFKDENLLSVLKETGATSLRFPGGSVTESVFTDVSFNTGIWDATSYVDHHGADKNLVSLNEFFSVASEIDAQVQLVIPTRVGFTTSAGDAVLNGTYGNRTDLDPTYLENVKRYIEQAINLAEKNEVTISKFEIGNEFWGSGVMTASEYGILAAKLTVFLHESYPDIGSIAQVTCGANRYSPSSDRDVFLKPDLDGGYNIVMFNEHEGEVPNDWIRTTLPGQGSATDQTKEIAEQFINYKNSIDILSGIVDHVYFDGGFSEVDEQRNYALSYIPEAFKDHIGSDELDYFISEWGPRNIRSDDPSVNAGNSSGLQYAHSTVEAFFEMASYGVDGANFWPTTFGYPSALYRTLINSVDESLTFGGVAFSWLSQGTINKTPLFDFEIDGQIDIHGFENDGSMSIFAAERSGDRDEIVSLDLGNFAPTSPYFTMISTMNSDDGKATSDMSSPVISYLSDEKDLEETISFQLKAWDLVWLELQYITDGNDTISGGIADDRIRGGGGNDQLSGSDGNDTVRGELGNDSLDGGSGHDLLNGGWGHDQLAGGGGDDVLIGGQNDDFLVGGGGADTLRDGSGHDTLTGGQGSDYFVLSLDGEIDTLNDFSRTEDYIDISEWQGTDSPLSLLHEVTPDGCVLIFEDELLIVRSTDLKPLNFEDIKFFADIEIDTLEVFPPRLHGDDIIQGDATNDELKGYAGADVIEGGNGDDTIWGGNGWDILKGNSENDVIYGGDGYDTISGGEQNDILYGNFGRDIIYGDEGNDEIFGGSHSDLISGGTGNDTLEGGSGADTIFGGANSDYIRGKAGSDILEGGMGSDYISGGINNDVIAGGSGNDTMHGGNGSDLLEGGNGQDLLKGNSGHDTLDGGDGSDILFGGIGSDTFIFNSGFDRIVDFQENIDSLVIDRNALGARTITVNNLGAIDISKGANSLHLDFGSGNYLEIDGVYDLSFILDDISFL